MQHGSNVVRFPVERRMELSIAPLHEVAPDVRRVVNLADGCGLPEIDPTVRARADAAMARRIAGYELPVAPVARRRLLRDLFQPLLEDALQAVSLAAAADRLAEEAVEDVFVRFTARGLAYPEQDVIDEAVIQAGERLVEAHMKCECAFGAWRAVSLALRSEPWCPYVPRTDIGDLLGGTA